MSLDSESRPFLKSASRTRHIPYDQDGYRWQQRVGKLAQSAFLSHLAVFLATSLIWLTIFAVTLKDSLWICEPPGAAASSSTATTATGTATIPFGTFINQTSKFLSCGSSTEEAKRRGCKYDILSNHWVPGPCMDQAAVEEYQSDNSWFGYADEAHTKLLTLEEMGEMNYWTNDRDHIVHCAMLWRKQFRAFWEQRQYLDSVIADEEHTMHCSQFLMDMSDVGIDWRKKPIEVEIGYSGCWMRE